MRPRPPKSIITNINSTLLFQGQALKRNIFEDRYFINHGKCIEIGLRFASTNQKKINKRDKKIK